MNALLCDIAIIEYNDLICELGKRYTAGDIGRLKEITENSPQSRFIYLLQEFHLRHLPLNTSLPQEPFAGEGVLHSCV